MQAENEETRVPVPLSPELRRKLEASAKANRRSLAAELSMIVMLHFSKQRKAEAAN